MDRHLASEPAAPDVSVEVVNPTRVLIKVGNSSSPPSLAGVIAHSIYEGKTVRVRAIGANAVNQAIKACIIARGYAAQRGMSMWLVPSFEVIPDEVAERDTSAVALDVLYERS
jgi:stage V sporulation protein S